MTCTVRNSDPLEDTSISQIPANVTLFGKRVFADVIKGLKDEIIQAYTGGF